MNPIAEVVGLVRTEFARRLRGWKRTFYAGAVGALLLTAAFVFVLIALFLYLAGAVGAPGAALIMSGALLVLGLIAIVIAGINTRKRNLQIGVQTTSAAQMEQMKGHTVASTDTSTLLKILGIAFAIGLFAGRKR